MECLHPLDFKEILSYIFVTAALLMVIGAFIYVVTKAIISGLNL